MSQSHTVARFPKRDAMAVAFALVLPTMVTLAYFVLADSFSPGVQQATYAIAKSLQFLFPVAWVVWVQHERSRIGWPAWRGVLAGVAFGAVIAATMLVLYHQVLKSMPFFSGGVEPIREKITGLGLDSFAMFVAVGVFYSLIHSLMEEYYWRWFVFDQLARLISLPLAIAISSLGFMAHHVIVIGTYFGMTSAVTWLFSAGVAVGGAVWAWLYYRSESLLGPWLSHLLVDAAIFIIGYDIAQAAFAGP